jgi:hypothetical protein
MIAIMKLGVILLMIVSMVINSLSFVFIYASFKIHQHYIATNLCIKKDEPVNTCGGHCQLVKKIQDHENQEKKAPQIREGLIGISYLPTIYRFLFALEFSYERYGKIYCSPAYSARATDQVFHPPKS